MKVIANNIYQQKRKEKALDAVGIEPTALTLPNMGPQVGIYDLESLRALETEVRLSRSYVRCECFTIELRVLD